MDDLFRSVLHESAVSILSQMRRLTAPHRMYKCCFTQNPKIDVCMHRTLVSFGVKQRALGEGAKTQEISNFKNTIGSLNRLIGRTLNDREIQEVEKKFLTCTLVDAGGTVGVKVSVCLILSENLASQDLR